MPTSFINNTHFFTINDNGNLYDVRKNRCLIYYYEPYLAIEYNNYSSTTIINSFTTHYSAVTSPTVTSAAELSAILQSYIDTTNISFSAGTVQNFTITNDTVANRLTATTINSTSISATTLSGGTIFSGGTNIGNLFSPTGHTHTFAQITNTAHTHSISEVSNLQSNLDTKVNKSGDTMTGGLITTSLTANTLNIRSLSGGGTLMVVTDNNGVISSQSIPSAGQSTQVLNGLNTYTGGTSFAVSVNISSVTLSSIFVSGSSTVQSFTATTISSGGTNIGNLFSPTGHTHTFAQLTNTAHTHSVSQIINLQSLLDTEVNKSGDTMTGTLFTPSLSATTLSGGTIFSGGTNINSLFATNIQVANAQTFVQPGINTYTGGTSTRPTVNISAITVSTINASGNTILSSLTATTISSGGTNIGNLFSTTGHTHTFAQITNTAHTHSVSEVINLQSNLNTKINKSGDTMTGGLTTTSLSATSLSGGTIFSGGTNIENLFSTNQNTLTQIANNQLWVSGASQSSIKFRFGNNNISGNYDLSFGKNNQSLGTHNFSFGNQNYSFGSYVSVLNGSGNSAYSFLNTITNGLGNYINSYSKYSLVGNGIENRFTPGINYGKSLTILNGKKNIIGYANYSSIINGRYNRIGYQFGSSIYGSTILAGNSNRIYSSKSTIIGTNNSIFGGGQGNTIINGSDNVINKNTIGSLVGGYNQNMYGNVTYSFMLGASSVIDSGNTNTLIFSHYAFISRDNTLNSILGGKNHTIGLRCTYNTILGGNNHNINHTNIGSITKFNALIGGSTNIIQSGISRTVIVGGQNISANIDDALFTDKIVARSLTGASTQMVVANSVGQLSVQSIPSAGQSTQVLNGLNTYTGGTSLAVSVNISSVTLSSLSVSGNSTVQSLTATTISSGGTNIGNLFSPTGHTHSFSQITNTAHTHSIGEIINLQSNLDTKVNKSGDTMTGQLNTAIISATTFSAGTINSGSTNIGNLFSPVGHTHTFAQLTNTAHTHSISEVINLQSNLNTKINKSGDTMTGGLITTSLSATSLSGGTIFSGGTNIGNIFVTSGINLNNGVSFFKQKSGNLLQFKSIYGIGGTVVTDLSNYITISSPIIPSSAYLWIAGSGTGSIKLNAGANYSNGGYSIVAGKANNVNSNSIYGTILNGKNNYLKLSYGARYSTVLNGSNNYIQEAKHSTILHGYNNKIVGYNVSRVTKYSSIDNGISNKIYYASHSVISNGGNNKISNSASSTLIKFNSITNGSGNTINTGNYSGIFNGNQHIIDGSYSTVLNGFRNTVTGNHSVILNGRNYNVTNNYIVLATKLRVPGTTSSPGNYMMVMDTSGYVFKTSLPSVGSSITITNGLNTYTGGTLSNPSINVSALTINTLSASGSSRFTTLSATTFSAGTINSGSTNIENIFSKTLSANTVRNIFINSTANTNSITVSSSFDYLAFYNQNQMSAITTSSNRERWYNNSIFNGVPTTTVFNGTTNKLMPIVITRAQIWDKMGFEVTVGASGATNYAAGAIYNSDTFGYPWQRIYNYGTASTTSNGKIIFSGDTPTLLPGLYYVSLAWSNAANLTCRCFLSGTFHIGFTSADWSTNLGAIFGTVSLVPPLVFSGASITTSQSVPAVYYHIKQYVDI